jgi:hypothetical protein
LEGAKGGKPTDLGGGKTPAATEGEGGIAKWAMANGKEIGAKRALRYLVGTKGRSISRRKLSGEVCD